MHNDVMMIRVSVKTARMFANGFNAAKDVQLSKQWH